MFSIEAIDAVIAAARAYSEWARETGDYPHDEMGCRAHEALLDAVRTLDGAATSPREAMVARIAALAGVDTEGGILPPDTTGGIDRTPSPWWKS